MLNESEDEATKCIGGEDETHVESPSVFVRFNAFQQFQSVCFSLIRPCREMVLIFHFKKMKAIFFIAVLSCATFAEVYGRKCYFCASTESFSKCDDERKEVDCSTLLPGYSDFSCAKLSMKKDSLSIYEKGCLPKSSCDDASKACKSGSTDCKINCCNSDLCNKGAGGPLVSGILILTSVVLAVFAI